MRMRVGVAIAAVVLWTAGTATAQECDTFDVCMAGTCQDGTCVGVPVNGGACDDFDDCTANDVCTAGLCMGSAAAAVGTRCASGCGTCKQLVIPGVPLQCMPDPEALNDPCVPPGAEELGDCFPGRCMAVSGVIAFCTGTLKTCPDDGNLCTGEFCNPATGDCDSSPLPARIDCFPFECHRCVPSTGACEPANVGSSCDDGNECTATTACSAAGECVSGVPQQTATRTPTGGASTPTRTATPQSTRTNTVAASTATPSRTPGTPTATPTQGRCVGDCDNSGQVSVNELITGVNIALDRAAFDQCETSTTTATSRSTSWSPASTARSAAASAPAR